MRDIKGTYGMIWKLQESMNKNLWKDKSILKNRKLENERKR